MANSPDEQSLTELPPAAEHELLAQNASDSGGATDGPEEENRPAAYRPGEDGAPLAVVGIGASAGGVQVLQELFGGMSDATGLAFVVVIHLDPAHASTLAEILQTRTTMPVRQVNEEVSVEANHVYVIPPSKHLTMRDSKLQLSAPQQATGKRVAIDLFFRTLAEQYGQKCACIILSGTDSDGVIGLKHVKAQGGVTIAQDPKEAEYDTMPRSAIDTGMVDWILPVSEMPRRLQKFAENEVAMTLPSEGDGEIAAHSLPDLAPRGPGGPLISKQTDDPDDERALRAVLAFVRSQTGHDFAHYKRATVLRRIARRLQVNGIDNVPAYLDFMRGHPLEARALLNDLLIGVTHFFRDQSAFRALATHIPQLFAGKRASEQVRVWVPGCATGEEAYSIAMLLCEQAERIEEPPQVQIFATDLDSESIHSAREGIYPRTIEVDVTHERLRRFFFNYHGRYRVKKELRELVLFADHDILRDSPFSRLDLISCRNLLIYLRPEAQHRVLDIFHFALKAGGLLFLGGSENVDESHALFAPIDRRNHIYVRRSTPRSTMASIIPSGRVPKPTIDPILPRLISPVVEPQEFPTDNELLLSRAQRRSRSLGELHVALLEQYAPPSVIVDENHDILHMSPKAAEFLHFSGGAPSTNLLKLADDSLRTELRTALFGAAQQGRNVTVPRLRILRDGAEHFINLHVRPTQLGGNAEDRVFLIVFEDAEASGTEPAGEPPSLREHEEVTRHLENELLELRAQLNATVEQYETANEELKASNEELQATNEEMRSATEELETSREELQSINEELTTVNHELKSNIDELGRTNSDLQNLMASTDIATLFLDRHLRIKRFTPRTSELFNVIAADIGRPLSDITRKVNYPDLSADATRVLDELGKVQREVQADGMWFLVRLAPYRTIDDKIDGVVLTFTDISERKRAEQALRESEEQFRRAIEMAPIPVIMHAEDGSVLQISRTWTELTGYSLDDVPTFDAWLTRAYGEGADEVRAHMHELFKGEKRAIGVEFPIRTATGEIRHWSFSASSPGTLRDGRRFIIGMAVDITDRKRTEEELRASEEWRRVSLVSNLIIWQVDPETGETHASENSAQVLNFDVPDNTAGAFALVHPDDKQRVNDAVTRAMRGDAPLDIEHRIVHPTTEQIIWVRAQGQLLQNAEAGHAWFVGLTQNITPQKEAEEALRESEERFRLLVEGAKDYAMFLLDLDNVITYWSSGAERLFGWSREEAVGQSGEIIFTPEDRAREEEEKEISIALRDGRAPDRRWHVRKDGSRLWIDGVMMRLDDAAGNPRGFAKIARDATTQREGEEALQHARDELEQRVLERTAELIETNRRLKEEASRRQKLESEILEVTERERARISQDLHDSLCQELTATAFLLKSRAKSIGKEDPEAGEALVEAAETVNANAGLARDLARGVHPPELGSGGLVSALRELASRTNEKVTCRCECPRSLRVPDENTAVNLYRIAQEAVTNAIKHAEPTEIVICIEREKNEIVLSITDDGEAKRRTKGKGGLGIHMMQYRASVCRGTLEVQARRPRGTKVTCRVPVKR